MERKTSKEMCRKHYVAFSGECRACVEENLYSARPDLQTAFRAGFKDDRNYAFRNEEESKAFVHGVAFRCEFVLVHINET